MVIFDNESNNESSEGEMNSDEEEVEEGAGHEFWPPDGGGQNVDVVKESREQEDVENNYDVARTKNAEVLGIQGVGSNI
ncbi:hypothetical protein Tco_0274702 [Tanacetum coccineum]